MIPELKRLINEKNRAGLMGEALPLLERLVALAPRDPEVRLQYGHALRTAGRSDAAMREYRDALTIDRTYGPGWWAIANMKTGGFSDGDVESMSAALESDIPPDWRIALHFALGKAFEDRENAVAAFDNYRLGNQQKRAGLRYDAGALTNFVDASERLFTTDFFKAREGFGRTTSAPIFVLGMPRSGSTLVEQILASHPSIEGLGEPTVLGTIARGLGQGPAFLSRLASLSPKESFDLGRAYVSQVPRTDRSKPFFVDKQPLNWLWTGLILLILPKAKIIDVRRNPLDCCWSNYRQNYASGVPFAYDLRELGLYYRDYTRLMAVTDKALPGRVHRLFYEDLVEDAEAETRRLLDYLRVPFDPACLRFHETERSIQTPSSEQVRQAMNRSGIGAYEPFAEWLGPLREALGPALTQYPATKA